MQGSRGTRPTQGGGQQALGLAIGVVPWVRHVGEQAAAGTLVFQVRFDSDGRVSMPGGGYGVTD